MATTSGGVNWETNGTPMNEASALNVDAKLREAAAAGASAVSAAVAPVQAQVSALSSRVDSQDAKTLAGAKAYTDTKVTGLATTAAMQAGDALTLSNAKTYTDGKVANLDPLPAGGTTGQVLTKTSTGSAWQNSPTGLPSGGSTGQVLTKTSTGSVWAEPAKGEKGDPGKDGADWSKDQQAKAQGYWIVVSPTEPESPTYTTADGVTVPVIWQKPIERMVPVVPEAPYFDKYALSIQVSDLVGVDYYLAGFTKDGAAVDVPDVKIPDGGVLKLADVAGKPALPYTVNVEARAEPGYVLPSPIAWTYSVVDPTKVVLFTSDTFTGRTADPAPLYNTNTDAALGGAAKLWDVTWEVAAGNRDRLFTVSGGALKVDLTVGRAAIGIKGIGFNQKAEFDLTFSSDATWGSSAGEGVFFRLAGNSALGGGGQLYLTGPYQGVFTVRVGAVGAYQEIAKKKIGELSGHYSVEIFESSMIVSIPGMAPVTVPVPRTFDPVKTWFSVEANSGQNAAGKGSFTIDNLKLSTIGF